jgi:hypothetical protein
MSELTFAYGVNLGGWALIEEKIVCKVVSAIEFSNLAYDICRVKIRKQWWVGSAVYYSICAKTHSNFNNWRYFRKKSVPAEPGSRVCGIFDRSMFKIHDSKLLD